MGKGEYDGSAYPSPPEWAKANTGGSAYPWAKVNTGGSAYPSPPIWAKVNTGGSAYPSPVSNMDPSLYGRCMPSSNQSLYRMWISAFIEDACHPQIHARIEYGR
jgi:hypothetical protein